MLGCKYCRDSAQARYDVSVALLRATKLEGIRACYFLKANFNMLLVFFPIQFDVLCVSKKTCQF